MQMASPVLVRHHPGVLASAASSEVVLVHHLERWVCDWPSVSQLASLLA